MVKAAGGQGESNFGPTLAHTQWWRLLKELGLTAEYLPRASAGRPKKERKQKKSEGCFGRESSLGLEENPRKKIPSFAVISLR
jgi:hypothetical protein